MADNWTSWYSGNMAPPLALPGGGYVASPSTAAPMSVDDIYRGIYSPPSPPSLSSVSRPSVPVNPSTGMPYATTASATMSGGPGIGYGAQGSVRYSPPVYQPNGTTVANKDQSRLPVVPAGLPLAAPTATGKARLGAGGFGSGSLTASMPSKASSVITLASEPMSEVSGQNTANSFGKPVKTPSGKTYYPNNTPMSGVRSPYDPKGAAQYSGKIGQDNRGPLSQMLGLKTSGLGGLLGGLFGGLLGSGAAPQAVGFVPGLGSSASAPSLGYNAAYSQTPTGDGQGNNAFSTSDGFWGGARSLTE